MTQTSSESMSSTPEPRREAPEARPALRFRFVALGVVALVAALVGFLALRDNGGSNPAVSEAVTLSARSVSATQIADLAKSVGHPVFWLGPTAGTTYELSRSANGSIFVRYLPADVAVGSTDAYMTVATYTFSGAYAALQKVAAEPASTQLEVAKGGLAVVSSRHPESVHVAYPGLDYEVEVYDPAPGAALSLVRNGKLAAFGNLAAGSSSPQAVTGDALRAFAGSLDHPVYWVGLRPQTTYELTQSQSGQIYVRYLPEGVAAGAKKAYLTVATYRFPGAFGAIKALAKQKNTTSLPLAGGGLAVLDTRSPTSAHLAFPGSDYQIEVFDTDASVVRNLIASGRVRTIG